ncbi:MAG: DUF2116 family Zn-ribbon domain-containing protein [Candidatus Freyarchaeota archaeon]
MIDVVPPKSNKQKSTKKTVAPHRHCLVCGVPIPIEEMFCSPECQNTFEKNIKKRGATIQRQYLLLILIIIVNIIWFIIVMSL